MMKRLILIFIFILIFILPVNILAAEKDIARIYFEKKYPNTAEYSKGERFILSIKVDNNDLLNAISGRVVLSGNADIESIVDSNSVITNWIERPVLSDDKKSIKFSGVILGGVSAHGSNIFDIVFRAQDAGELTVDTSDMVLLRHDGAGSSYRYSVDKFSSTISSDDSREIRPLFLDTSPPQRFTPFVFRDRVLTDNLWVVSFETQDRGSGVSQYMVKELGSDFVGANSPYTLKNQFLSGSVIVRAIDNMGNYIDEESVVMRENVYMGIVDDVLFFVGIAGIVIYLVLLRSRLY